MITRPALIVLGLLGPAACHSNHGAPSDAGPKDQGSGMKLDACSTARPDADTEHGPQSDWEDACVGWTLAGCRKAEQCGITPSCECGKTEAALVRTCQASAKSDGCARPERASFEECTTRDDGKSCEEYCSGPYCFSFCFYKCLEFIPDGGVKDAPGEKPSDAAPGG